MTKTPTSAIVTRAALLIGLALAAPRAASAQAVVGAANVSTNMGNLNATAVIGNVINQTGLSAGYTSGVTNFATYTGANPTHDSSSTANIWLSANGTTTGNVDFNLGGTFTIDRFALWNLGADTGFNLVGFNLVASPDSSFTTTTSLGSFTAGTSGTQILSPLQVFTFTATATQFVRMQITSNNGGSFTGFGEAVFRGTAVSAVPEPSTLALGSVLAAAGLGSVAVRRRRARRAA
ncbi:MAG: hypothetical protein U0835_21740 [Isosphaeraceae bacterium]